MRTLSISSLGELEGGMLGVSSVGELSFVDLTQVGSASSSLRAERLYFKPLTSWSLPPAILTIKNRVPEERRNIVEEAYQRALSRTYEELQDHVEVTTTDDDELSVDIDSEAFFIGVSSSIADDLRIGVLNKDELATTEEFAQLASVVEKMVVSESLVFAGASEEDALAIILIMAEA